MTCQLAVACVTPANARTLNFLSPSFALQSVHTRGIAPIEMNTIGLRLAAVYRRRSREHPHAVLLQCGAHCCFNVAAADATATNY